MAMKNSSLCTIFVLLSLFACSTCENSVWTEQKNAIPAPTWCVANKFVTNTALQAFIDFCCQQLDCVAIKPGGECYQPNNPRGHGSYALDLYYRTNKNCFQNIGMLVYEDPSYGNCLYL